MLSTFLRSGCRACIKAPQWSQYELIAQRLASFTARNIIHETSDESGTLLTRFAKHIAFELQRDVPLVSTSIRYPDYFPITDIHYLQKELNRIAPDQLPALIIFAFTYRASADPNKYAILLNELDATAMRLLPNMDLDTILRTLYSFLYLMPNWIMRIDFYNAALNRLTASADSTIPKEKFVQICFYLGLEKNRTMVKRDAELFHKLLEKHLEFYLPKLSTLDLIVVANAAFKTSTRVESDAYNSRLVEEMLKLPMTEFGNDALLITLVKAMRLQRVRSADVCESLKGYCNEETLVDFQTRGLIHLLAYFAENLWDEKYAVEPIIKECLNRLLHKYEDVRCKDLATFLWCCAHLNCELSTNEIKQIESILMNKVDRNEFQYFADQLVNSCLSLWMLDYKSQPLLEATVESKLQAQLKAKNRRDLPKVDSRFQVLLTAVEIEEPTWRFRTSITTSGSKIDTVAPSYLLNDRIDLTDTANKLAEELCVDFTKLVCPINGINIPSILIKYKEPDDLKVFVEILTEAQQLRFSNSPVGLMQLKMRLMKALGCKIAVLHAEQLKDGYDKIKDMVLNVEIDELTKAQSLKV